MNKKLERQQRERKREAKKRYRWELKHLVLSYYSTKDYPICAICGRKDITTLTIDHVFGGGNKHRRELGFGGYKEFTRKNGKIYKVWINCCGYVFYRWLKANDFPSGYRVLCQRCNTNLVAPLTSC